MKINGIEIDAAKLVSKNELLDEVKDGGASDRALSDIRNRYYEAFDNELMWRYPISDSENAGVVIIVVKEGFIALPYNNLEPTEYELFDLEKAYMLDDDDLERFIDDWKMFSDDLLAALGDMKLIVQSKQEVE